MRKKTLALVATLVLALSCLAVVVAKIYWTRTVTHDIHIVGIDAELLVPTVDGHSLNEVTTNLSSDDKIAITIYEENYEVIWLNVSAATDCPGLVVLATGQYVNCHVDTGVGHYDYVGDPFTLNMGTQQAVDKLKMMYGTVADGYMLEIAFAWDTEACFELGDYTVDLTFSMGFV
jgi:hypothetical protein